MAGTVTSGSRDRHARSPPSGTGAPAACSYLPRRPEDTLLYALVREHLEPFLAHASEAYQKPLPRYVVAELRGYLRCGVFAHGFVHCHCDACGCDLLVALSCKGRGMCPSCGTRRMCNEASHLTDRVLPDVPIRQWVLSLPFELRRLAAFNPDALTMLGRIFVETIFRAQKGRGGGRGECGAVTLVQRFGGSLNLNVHFHVLVLDGVFTFSKEGGPLFHAAPPPSSEELAGIARTVYDRALRWLRKKGHLDERAPEDRSNEVVERTAIDGCADVALQGGAIGELPRTERGVLPARVDAVDDPDEPRASGRLRAEHGGFNLHAGVRIAAGRDEARELLVRYCARPSFALDRLSVLADGRIAYRVKAARAHHTHRLMTPVEFLARLAALIAPPRYPLVRYHGVLAPHSKWRGRVVPRPRPVSPKEAGAAKEVPRSTASTPAVRSADDGKLADPAFVAPREDASRKVEVHTSLAASSPVTSPPMTPSTQDLPPGVELGDGFVSVRHWDRLMGGLLLARAPRVPWATLLRRTHAIDVLECAKCGGRLRIVGAVMDPDEVRAILDRLGVPAQSARASPARPNARA